MAVLGIFLGILCFTAYSFIVNKSQLDRCNIYAFTACLYLVGFLSCLMTVMTGGSIKAVPSVLLTISVFAGAASLGGFLTQLSALRSGGRLSVINIISNLSTLIPIIYSIAVFNEKVSLTKYIGIILFVVFIFMLNDAGKEEAI